MQSTLQRAFRATGLSIARARRVACRSMAVATATSLEISSPGEPSDVLRQTKTELEAPENGQVLLQILAAPINPSDINTVQGKYPIPAAYNVPGHEGVAQVLQVGAGVSSLKEGMKVVPLRSGLGTWRTHGIFSAQDWHPVPDELSIEHAATLTINPGTALGMLEGYEELEAGDVVVQNGGNSTVGQLVIQLARRRGVTTVNMVRERDDWDAVAARLQSLGADVVVRPEDMRAELKKRGLAPPKLGLNCVGGESASAIIKSLAPGGTMVTYGGMSMQPVTVPTPVLIFRDVKVRGFWISGGALKDDVRAKASLFDRLAQEIVRDGLEVDTIDVNFHDDWRATLQQAESGSSRKGKYLFRM